ncbi:hypothetical protein CDD83_4236 [Cordyceps sp. RAO-2017]|nr:hypothetical protein CDD83_4236 [Cordyceps sp. RAO-2017]
MRPVKRQASQALESDSSLQQGQSPNKRRVTMQDDLSGLPSSFFTGPYFSDQVLPPALDPFIDDNSGFDPFGGQPVIGQTFMLSRLAEPPIMVAGHTLSELLLDTIPHMNTDRARQTKEHVADELEYQRQNPPALPPSQVADLPPKEDLPDYCAFPDGVNDSARLEIEKKNNRIAAMAQKVDRQRNNMAAKKSRALRLESLDMYRKLYITATAMIRYYRLSNVLMGYDPNMWERMPQNIRDDLVASAMRDAEAVENTRAEIKKQDEARKRAQRVRAKNERRARQAATEAVDEPQASGTTAEAGENLQVVTPPGDNV